MTVTLAPRVHPNDDGWHADIELPGGLLEAHFEGDHQSCGVVVKSPYLGYREQRATDYPYASYELRGVPYRVEIRLWRSPKGGLYEPVGSQTWRTIKRLDDGSRPVSAAAYRDLMAMLSATAQAVIDAMPDGWRRARAAFLSSRREASAKEIERLQLEVSALVADDIILERSLRLVEQTPEGQLPVAHPCPEPRRTLR